MNPKTIIHCPNCHEFMENQWSNRMRNDATDEALYEIVAHCWHCDYDVEYQLFVDQDGQARVGEIRRFFFG